MKRFSWLRSRTVKTLRREIHLSWLDVKRNFATPGIQPTMMQNVGMPLKVFSTQAMVLGTLRLPTRSGLSATRGSAGQDFFFFFLVANLTTVASLYDVFGRFSLSSSARSSAYVCISYGLK